MNGHSSLEDPGLDPDPQSSDRIHEMSEQGFGSGRFFGAVKARPPSLPDRAGQRKLRDRQDFAADIGQRQVHLSGCVRKYPELDSLVGQEVCVLAGVSFFHSHQKAEPTAAPAHNPAACLYRSFFHALQNDSHRLTLWGVYFIIDAY
jgi:hypothetical protein